MIVSKSLALQCLDNITLPIIREIPRIQNQKILLERGALYILERITKSKLEQFTMRELLRLCKKFKTSHELADPLTILVERDYIREVKQTYTGTGRPPGIVYEVNPNIF